MTTLQVHLLMLGLSLIAYLFLAGVLSNRKSHSRRLRRQWWTGVIASIVVAASPLSRFWREPVSGIELLIQSLLIAAICLLFILLIALLRFPLRAINSMRKQDEPKASAQLPLNQSAGLSLMNDSKPFVINADAPESAMQSTDAAGLTPAQVTVDRSAEVAGLSMGAMDNGLDNSHAAKLANTTADVTAAESPTKSLVEEISTDKLTDNDLSLAVEDDQVITKKLEVAEIESIINTQTKSDGARGLDDTYRQAGAANDNDSKGGLPEIKLNADKQPDAAVAHVDEERLDLSETEELFAEIRQQTTTVELPNEDELRRAKAAATIDELDLDTQLIPNEQTPISKLEQLDMAEASIEEAEVVELDETSLEFGNDLTGEYSHPDLVEPNDNTAKLSGDSVQHPQVPETLDDAIIAAKASAASLQAQVSNLEGSITELDTLRDESMQTANTHIEQRDMLLLQKDDLLRSEDEARQAAESVIAAQSALIDRTKRQQAVVSSLLQDERKRLTVLQVEVLRSRKMARTAAQLARRAAVAQQEIRDVAKREQVARLKSQESTRKAVTIARNAISALAAEERKRGLIRH